MGYSHYVTQPRDFTHAQWAEIVSDIRAICNDVQHVQGIPLANANGEGGTQPEFSDDCIMINGLAPNDYETFCINRKVQPLEPWQKDDRRGWDFCKTGDRPYDICVTACLAYLESIHGLSVTSDGRGNQWIEGVEEARRALPQYANQIDIPLEVRKADRWSWKPKRDAKIGTLHTDKYDIGFCIDGAAYIYEVDNESKCYRFPTHAEAALYFIELREPASTRPFPGHPSLWVNCGGPLFNAAGVIDDKRRQDLKVAQERVLKALIAQAPKKGRAIAPPAFARPRAMTKVANDQPKMEQIFDLVA